MRASRKKGQGAAIKWIRDHVGYAGDDCLTWPFHRNRQNGYGSFGHLGEHYYAHRYMCELVKGPPPPAHECAHSCGKGHEGCVNPRHLSWKTKSGNLRDCGEHGTSARNLWGRFGRLTKEQVAAIKALKGKETQDKIAARFGISASSVRDIYLGRTYRNNDAWQGPSK